MTRTMCMASGLGLQRATDRPKQRGCCTGENVLLCRSQSFQRQGKEASNTPKDQWSVTVSFRCWLDWSTECPGIWSNIILGDPVRVFLDEFHIWIDNLSKADCPPWSGGPPPIELKDWTEQKGWPSPQEGELPLCAWLPAGTGFFLPFPWNINSS